jgi:TonB family protein
MARRRATLIALALFVSLAGCAAQPPSEGSGAREFVAYRATVLRAVKANYHADSFRGTDLTAAVVFGIAPDGTLTGAHIIRSSGNAGFDAAALRAVADTGHVPPVPPRWLKEFSEFLIEFHPE